MLPLRLTFITAALLITFATSPRWALGVGGEGILVPLENWTVLSDSPPGDRLPPEGGDRPAATKHPPAVLLVPGMMAGDDTMSALRSALRTDKIPVAMFRYDSQLGADRVAARLATVLAAEEARLPNRDIVLVTHSMGGIIARCALEDPTCKIRNVSDLIMIAPPNGGSSLATLDGSKFRELLQAFEADELKRLVDDETLGIVNDTLELFLGKARRDLAPESELLTRLNAFPRNPDVKYSILAGTKAPIPPLARGIGQLVISRLIAQNPQATQKLRTLLATADREEWIAGLGDGVVSVKSTYLLGVADHVALPFSHGDSSEPLDNPATGQLVREVIVRLPRR
jgi:pimeloyl-ACP methyl ester carboxylesterase